MRVRAMTSPKSGRAVPNQYIIEDGSREYFQSYQSIISMKGAGMVYLDKNDWDYSRTTLKYFTRYMRENTAEIRKKIKDGVYELRDLN